MCYLFKTLISFLLGIYSEVGTAGSYGRSIINFSRNLCIVFHSGWTNLHSHQQCVRGSLFTTSSQALVFLIASLTVVRCYLKILANQDFPGGAVVKNPSAMQGTQAQALVQEDPTCRRATKPMRHKYWACALESASHNYWARVPQLLKSARLEPVLRNKRSHRNEKPMNHNEE